MQVILQPCSDGEPAQHFEDTIRNLVDIADHTDVIDTKTRNVIAEISSNGNVALWGLVPNNSVTKYERMEIGATALFVGGGRAFYAATVAAKFRNRKFAQRLWGTDEEGRTWEYMYALIDGRNVSIDGEALNEALGYLPHARVQGFTVKDGDSARRVLSLLGQTPTTAASNQGFVFQSNPDLWDIVDALISERTGNYAVNQMRSKIEVDDTIYFRRTGSDSGIYAIGIVTSPSHDVPNDFGKWTCGYRITHAVRPPLLTKEIARDPVIGSNGTLRGRQYTNALLDQTVRERLDDLLDSRLVDLANEDAAGIADAEQEIEVVANPRRPGRRGQGFGLSAAQRRAIEIQAVAVATSHLESDGWVVEDVGATRSYDLHATKGSTYLIVEVKGTTSLGESVLLTHNEVQTHRDNYPNTALMVVKGIALTESNGSPVASGGTLAVHQPWKPEAKDLQPLSFRYVVPE